ncbi:MAG: DUF169 domain-containing protein [Archaeoglobi archaeon]|nr:DUF169 domain-containing protein [Candidatus Mnemosynella bozhongmuii]
MNWSKYSEELVSLLRLRTHPVGVRFYEDELESEVEKPLTLCQMVTLARVWGESVVANRKSVFCSIAKHFLGFEELPEDIPERFAGRRTRDAEGYRRIIEDMPAIEKNRFRSAVIAPLSKFQEDPHLILIFCDGAQMTRLLHSATWKDGRRVSVRTSAEAGTCGEGIASAFVRDDYNIAFPCYGTRVYALARDDELIFSFPSRLAEELMEGLKKTHELMSPYPPRVQLRPAAEIERARRFLGRS